MEQGIEITEGRIRDLMRSASPEHKKRYEPLVRRVVAAGKKASYRDSVRVHCLECCAWQHAEVKRCEIAHCALYGKRTQIFGGGDE